MAGSFQLVIVPAKMPAMVAGSRLSVSTPSRLKITAIGEMYSGSSTMVGVGRALGEAARGDLLVVERAVGAGEVARALEERLATGARARGVVVDRDVGVGGLEAGDPGLLGGVLRRRAGADEVARERRLRAGLAAGGAALVRGAGAERECRGDGDDGGGAETLEVHVIPFRGSIAGVWAGADPPATLTSVRDELPPRR